MLNDSRCDVKRERNKNYCSHAGFNAEKTNDTGSSFDQDREANFLYCRKHKKRTRTAKNANQI